MEKKYKLVGMSNLEIMYLKGVPLETVLLEAQIQVNNGALEIGAGEFLRTHGVRLAYRMTSCTRKNRADRRITG